MMLLSMNTVITNPDCSVWYLCSHSFPHPESEVVVGAGDVEVGIYVGRSLRPVVAGLCFGYQCSHILHILTPADQVETAGVFETKFHGTFIFHGLAEFFLRHVGSSFSPARSLTLHTLVLQSGRTVVRFVFRFCDHQQYVCITQDREVDSCIVLVFYPLRIHDGICRTYGWSSW